ncbi:MAG: endolytic transglycosylase MltG [Treponema sp.]|nr:endolytic transglycosylase MltG [Treponema sp.]
MPRIVRLFCGILAALIAIAVIFGGGAIAVLVYLNSPPETVSQMARESSPADTLRLEDDGKVFIEIRDGESSYSVGQRLEKAGIIRSRYLWNLLSYMDKEYIKTGSYRFGFPATQLEIRSVLVEGKQLLIRVTVPEGVTLKKIAAILEGAGICTREAFLQSASDRDVLAEYRIPGLTMEGYLYPDTYLFPASYPAREVIRTMAGTFFARLAETGENADSLPPEEINRKVILASIVEREYRVADEAPLMAGVFYNRLETGMALQSCATVEYVITEIQGKPHPRVLYTRDTEIPDPYNTYLRPGLPPGPISSPGKVALDAAFRPASSDYLYFRLVNPEEGRHYFSKNFDEHIKAGTLYVKGGGF